MNIAAWGTSILEIIEANADLAGPITFALAFGESMVLLGLILPATVVLAGAGVLAGLGVLDFWTMVMWGAPGAFLGDAVSFWLGRRCGPFMLGLWPMNKRPELVERGRAFFVRHGAKSVFIGRFFGPLRAMVPLIAGMMGMTQLRFQLANAASAILWIIGLMAPGAMVGFGLEEALHHPENGPMGYMALAAGAAIAVMLFIWLKRQV